MKKLIFICPFLLSKKGHYYHMAKSLYDSASSNNIDFRIIVSSDCSVDNACLEKIFRMNPTLPFFSIKKLFSIFNKIKKSGNFINKDGGPEIVVAKNKSVLSKFLINIVDVLNIFYMNIAYYFDFKKALRSENINNDVSLFIEFPHKYFIFGLWLWMETQKLKPHLFFNFSYPQKLLKTTNILFGKYSDFLVYWYSQSKIYEKIINKKIYVINQPVICNILKSGNNKKRTFGIVGTLRYDRGLQYIPRIIEKSLKKYDINFLIHSNIVRNDYSTNKIINELKKLEFENINSIKLITSELNEKEYFEILNSIDVVLLPYGTDTYCMNGSGVFAECSVMGKVIIVPYYVEPTDDEYSNKCCWRVHSNSPEDFVSAIEILSKDEPFNTMKKEAEKIRLRLRDKFNSDTYLQNLLNIRKKDNE